MFQDLQIDGFMVKPFEIDQLVREASLIIKRRSQQAPHTRLGGLKSLRRVCLVEHDQGDFERLGGLLLNADYTLMPARSGTDALEKMMAEAPDAALVDLGLSDIPGDIVIYRLSQMPKTMDVKFLLYTSRTGKHDPQVMDRISAKTGIWTFVEYDRMEEVLDTLNTMLASP
jgi:DNA-binding response OmpR family regulator